MYGLLICIGILVAALLFVVGVFLGGRAGYIALAVPVTMFTLGVLGLGFWIGWTIFSIKVEPPEPEEKEEAKK
jgi:uncharacterized membrane protein